MIVIVRRAGVISVAMIVTIMIMMVVMTVMIMTTAIGGMGMSMLDHYKRIEEPRDFTRTCSRYTGGHSHENVRRHSGVQRG